jgi:hypothetical protein
MPISRTDAQFRQAATEKFERAKALDWLSKAEFLSDEAKRSFQQGNMTAYRQLLGGASTAMGRAIGAMSADEAAISDIFTASVRAEEAPDTKAVVAEDAPLDAAKVRSDALKTLHDLMTDDSIAITSRTDIAKFIIENSRIG